MLISHQKKFIYTKTVKTGGTSTEVYFEPFCMRVGEYEFSHNRDQYISETGIVGYRGKNAEGKTWYNHMSAQAIKNLLGSEVWTKYFKFCVIRNPFERYVSAFYYMDSIDMILYDDEARMLDEIDRFRWWMSRDGVMESLVDRDKYMIADEICVDFFIQYERLLEDINFVCQKLDVPFVPQNLMHLKSGIRNTNIQIASYYDEYLVEKLQDLYATEIVLFGYDLQKNR